MHIPFSTQAIFGAFVACTMFATGLITWLRDRPRDRHITAGNSIELPTKSTATGRA